MQSRRRFFCARVELVQLARAFLCPATGHAGTMDGGTGCESHSPGRKLYHTPTAATEGAQSHATGQGYRNTATPGKAANRATEGAQMASHSHAHSIAKTGNPRKPPYLPL